MQNNIYNIAILISGSGSNLQAIIDHVQQGHINASVACVISDNLDAYGLTRAKQADIPTHVIEHAQYASRDEFEKELSKTLKVYNIGLIVLAGFMRVLSDSFVDEYQYRILNIHPSLLPKFPGLHTHQRALEAGETEHGCSVHFVTADLDQGPLIIQAKVLVNNSDDPDSLAKRVLEKEHIIYPLTVKWFSQNKLSCADGDVYFENKPLDAPILLTSKFEAELQ